MSQPKIGASIYEWPESKRKKGLKKGESSYSIILSLGRVNGRYKQKWITFHGTRAGVETRRAELLAERRRGEFIEPSKKTLGEYLDEWLEVAIRPPQRSQNTYVTYRIVIDKHVKPSIGHVLLQALRPWHVEQYYAALTLGRNSACLHRTVLNNALKAAANKDYIRENPAPKASNKPQPHSRDEDLLLNVWTAEEAQRFLRYTADHCTPHDAALFRLALDSGCRKGELLALQWRDLNGSTLRIERQLLKDGIEPTFSWPKTRRTRSLNLTDGTVKLLLAHKSAQAELKMRNRTSYTDLNLIFAREWDEGEAHPIGTPLNVMWLNRRLSSLSRAAGVKRLTVHGLRHTCATLSLAAGVPANVVQHHLGHKKIAITLDVYGHVIPTMQHDAALKRASVLSS